MTSPYPPAVHAMADHVLKCLRGHQARYSAPCRPPPLFVGVQGPQGSGKTYLTSRLRALLTGSPHALSVAVLSIDDLYLPHAELVALAERHPHNRLLHGRGQPGTHDVTLGREVLSALRRINDPPTDGEVMGGEQTRGPRKVDLPVFDKSLFGGEGDRVVGEGEVVRGPVDVVVFEGWCVGFYPVPRGVVEARWAAGSVSVPGPDDVDVDMDVRTMARVEDVLEVNELLEAYVEWWHLFDAFVQIRGPLSSPYAIIYRWRLQQEHDMKAKNGGRGMTDAQVKTFVDRYIPGYVFFGDGVQRGTGTGVDDTGSDAHAGTTVGCESPPWLGCSLVLELDVARTPVGTRTF